MALLHRTQIRRSIFYLTSYGTSQESCTEWTTIRRGSRPTCSISQAFSSALHVRKTHFIVFFFGFIQPGSPERPRGAPLPPIIHYAAEEPFTKYEICLVFARILNLPHAHIIPDAGPPPPGTGYVPSLAALDLMRFFSSPFLFWENLKNKKRVHAASAKHPIISAGD